MIFYKNTEMQKVLACCLICALLTISFAPITKAKSDYEWDDREDMQAQGSAYASVWYADGEIQSSHYTTAWIWREGGSLDCTSLYRLSATQVIGQFETSIIEPKNDQGAGTAKNDALGNADTHAYYHSTSLSAVDENRIAAGAQASTVHKDEHNEESKNNRSFTNTHIFLRGRAVLVRGCDSFR